MLFNSAGFLGAFLVSRADLRESFASGERNSHTQPIKITAPADELKWEDESECWYNGILYDVVKTETVNGSPVYYAVADDEEQQLAISLSRHVSSDHPANTNTENIFLPEFLVPLQHELNTSVADSFPLSALEKDDSVLEGYYQSSSPPPDLA